MQPDRGQRPHSRGNDRERITRARQAAEALFAPKQQITEQPVVDTLPLADQSVRKPRVLATSSPPVPIDVEAEPPAAGRGKARPEIPVAKLAYIRVLVKYGMTVAQVAQVYGVPADAIERILRKS